MKRILNPAKHLQNLLPEGNIFYIGFGIKDLTEVGKGHPGVMDLIAGSKTSVIVSGKKGALRENTIGKLVRKQPEAKESIWKHIHYYSKRFGKEIDYDRQFHVWEKTMLHKYNLALEVAITPQGETILHFPAFTMQQNEDTYLRAGAAMNMAIALGSYFLPYDHKFEPLVPVTKFEKKQILPPGRYSISEKLEIIDRELVSSVGGEVSEGNSYRFAVLKEKNPTDVTMGIGGFNEYLMFEFVNEDLIVLENLKTGNATFVFKLSNFNKKEDLNKQTATVNPSFLKRIIHNNLDDWSRQFGTYFRN